VAAVAMVAVLAVRAQQRASAPTLTALDYIQIQQLVARYPYALDTGANNGYAFANLFAPGATFGGSTTGLEQLADLARGGHYKELRGPLFTLHHTSNHVIDPSPEGAVGKVYVVEIFEGERGVKPTYMEDSGHYEDAYVKTSDGWRFKARTFVHSKAGPQPGTGDPGTTR
jgi:hypothetical protein